MKRSCVLVSVVAGLLAVPTANGSSGGASCVGQYSSTFARQSAGTFGADISFGAQFASQPNFGAGVVAPFAHLPRTDC